MLIDTKHVAAIPARLLPALFYLFTRADGRAPDAKGYVVVTLTLREMAQALRKTRRAVMGNLRDLESSRDVIRVTVPGQANKYKVRVRREDA